MRSTPSTSQNSNAEPSWSLIRLVSADRDDEEQADREQPATATIVPTQHAARRSASSSSSSCALAEIAERLEADLQRLAERDDAADHRPAQRAVAPAPRGRAGYGLDSISPPSGVRTATAQVETPRIITPSSTAWPPTGASRLRDQGAVGQAGLVGHDRWIGRARGGLQRYAAAARLAARRWKRSTRPPVSTSFCLPV